MHKSEYTLHACYAQTCLEDVDADFSCFVKILPGIVLKNCFCCFQLFKFIEFLLIHMIHRRLHTFKQHK